MLSPKINVKHLGNKKGWNWENHCFHMITSLVEVNWVIFFGNVVKNDEKRDLFCRYYRYIRKSCYERLEFPQLSCAREVKLVSEFGRWFDVWVTVATCDLLRRDHQLYSLNFSHHWCSCKYMTSWWLNQPIWKICGPSNWIISPGIGVKIKNIWNHLDDLLKSWIMLWPY